MSTPTQGKRRRATTTPSEEPRKAPRRTATLYDAVAGRIGPESFLTRCSSSSSTAHPRRPGSAVYPEEALFRQRRAPIRYEETDTYFAHERLPPNQPLPDSDLLKAIHVYVSEFYARNVAKPEWSYRSLDETALLALGVLLEGLVARRVGETGDLAFLEGEEEERRGRRVWDGREWRRSVLLTNRRAREGRGRGAEDDG
ncbi:hypothetical protein ANO11243_072780 [Dothideomycetidae sp. 11243]|nr:hypothetical protein ANO11243_072780 [fungal sp. No.11243]